MDVQVYVGPSIDPERHPLCARFFPPAARGDIYRNNARSAASVLVLIDGVFDGQASVLHKELVWLIDQGTVVMGAASMGALRAAELADVGMLGHGEIYRAYRAGWDTPLSDRFYGFAGTTDASWLESEVGDASSLDRWCELCTRLGVLIDDDDVALLHAPAELGYRKITEPMVNLVYTFRQCDVEEDVLRRLLRRLKAVHFRERTPAKVRAIIGDRSIFGAADVIEFERSYDEGYSDIKQADAKGLLDRVASEGPVCLRQASERGGEAEFVVTRFWRQMLDELESEPPRHGSES